MHTRRNAQRCGIDHVEEHSGPSAVECLKRRPSPICAFEPHQERLSGPAHLRIEVARFTFVEAMETGSGGHRRVEDSFSISWA